MFKTFFFSLITLLIIFITGSCGGDNSQNNEFNDDEHIVGSDTVGQQTKSFVYTKYKLPLSIDVYRLLKSKKIDFNIMNLHSLEDKEKYFTGLDRALMLGIYSSDLAYATIFDKSQETIDYFEASIDLAQKLDIEKGYDTQLLKKVNDNLNNNDSISQIISEAYLETCTFLEKENKANILPFIVLASWIESIYILSQEAFGSLPEDGIYSELYNQKNNLDGIVNYLKDVGETLPDSEKKEIQNLLLELEQLNTYYNKIDKAKIENLGTSEFKDILLKILEIRQDIIQPNNQ